MSVQMTPKNKELFQYLAAGPVEVQKLADDCGLDQTIVMSTMTHALNEKWVTIESRAREEVILVEGAMELVAAGLPERRFLPYLAERKSLTMAEVANWAKEKEVQVAALVKWGEARGWLKKDKGTMQITPTGEKAAKAETLEEYEVDERILGKLCEKWQRRTLPEEEHSFFLDELPEKMPHSCSAADLPRLRELWIHRTDLVKVKERTERKITLTPTGLQILQEAQTVEQKNQLTSEDIVSGNWQQITWRPYSVDLAAQKRTPPKIHPLQKILQEARRAFLDMGFCEVVSPQVELSFWDFDALFQPQDHPSRDMQDTFYMSRPEWGALPEEKLVERIRATHEHGWQTGSTGWGYQWDPREAQRIVLRTHTTATSIRALTKHPQAPLKVFCVGRVFRNETINYKHLPEFHQVDGMIVDPEANLCTLLGTLREFYRKMGFDQVKFKPDFFPYTEPSAAVLVWMPKRKCWIELGGSGIFRPEVTRPLGCELPVLAWGLGLERVAMLRYGVDDIRTLYSSDLDWLEGVRLCQ